MDHPVTAEHRRNPSGGSKGAVKEFRAACTGTPQDINFEPEGFELSGRCTGEALREGFFSGGVAEHRLQGRPGGRLCGLKIALVLIGSSGEKSETAPVGDRYQSGD